MRREFRIAGQSRLRQQFGVELRLDRAERNPLSVRTAIDVVERRPAIEPVRRTLAGMRTLRTEPIEVGHQRRRPVAHRGIDHLLRIIDQTGCRVIFDHYALRDAAYPERFRRLWETGYTDSFGDLLRMSWHTGSA